MSVENTGRGRGVQGLNDLQALGQLLYSTNNSITELLGRISGQELQSLWTAFGTCALNGDGSLGAPDGSPNNDHPINPNTAPGLNHVITANQYITLEGALATINTAINGVMTQLELAVEHS